MPIKASAKKALRQSKKRRLLNLWHKKRIKEALKKGNDLSQIYKVLDKAAKRGIISKQKAARKKSQAAQSLKSLSKNPASKAESK
jgi:small subunit ribosomal protein S20